MISSKKKKILLIGPFPPPISGVSLANKVVKEVLSYRPDYKVSIVNTSFPTFDEGIGKFSIKKLFFYLLINFKVTKVFSSEKIYITPGQTFFGVLKYFLFITIASLLKKELIIHVHGNHLGKEYENLSGLKKKLFYYLISKFDKGIVLSESLKHNLTSFLQEKSIFSLPNFAENYLHTEENLFCEEGLRIIYLSNLMYEKGIIDLLKALNKLEELEIPYKAKIAGNIDENLLPEVNNHLGKLKNTEYIGVVKGEKKKEMLEWGNIFTLPTFYKMEGQPISILEAMATKNLILTTDHAGIPDVVKNGEHGFYVEKNDFNSIAETLMTLSNNSMKIKEIALKNKEYFLNNYTVDRFKENLIRIIEV